MLFSSCERRDVTGAHAGTSALPLSLLAQVELAAAGSVGGSEPSWFARPPWASCDDLGADTPTLLQFGNYASKKWLARSSSAFSCTLEGNLFTAFVYQPWGGFHQHLRLPCVLNYLSGKRKEFKKRKEKGTFWQFWCIISTEITPPVSAFCGSPPNKTNQLLSIKWDFSYAQMQMHAPMLYSEKTVCFSTLLKK